MARRRMINKGGGATKTPIAQKKGNNSAASFGFGNPYKNPNKKLAGPVTSDRRDVKVDKKKGRPDRPLKGPVGAIFPIPQLKPGKRRGKAK